MFDVSIKELYKENDEDKDVIGKIKEGVIFLVVAVILIVFISKVLIINTTVPTSSMENTIMAGDRVIGNRLAYKFTEPKRGDIIIFYAPDEPNKKYIKRIIGLPGETVRILEGKVIINNEVIQELYLKDAPNIEAFGPYRVPGNGYFVLGDNRNASDDARFWVNAYVLESQIIAKANISYWPEFKNLK